MSDNWAHTGSHAQARTGRRANPVSTPTRAKRVGLFEDAFGQRFQFNLRVGHRVLHRATAGQHGL